MSAAATATRTCIHGEWVYWADDAGNVLRRSTDAPSDDETVVHEHDVPETVRRELELND